MNGFEYFKLAFQKYADFDGRSRRSEYWYFVLFNAIVGYGLLFIGGAISLVAGTALNGIYSLAALIPNIAVSVRRLHDIGKSGWWLLIAFTGIGVFVLLFWLCQDSDTRDNEYGSSPKYGSSNDVTDHLVDEDLV